MTVTEPTPETLEEQSTDALPSEDGDEALVDEVLVEEISIDGMCGVY